MARLVLTGVACALVLAAGAAVTVLLPQDTRVPAVAERSPRPVPARPRRPPETRAARAARLAVQAVGTPYRWGGSSLSGFDCSGLVMWAFGRAGVRLPHNAWSQSRLGRVVTRRQLRPGDLLFFHGFGHVGIYLGRGRMVHAPQSGERVEVIRLAGLHGRRFETARRLYLS